MFSDEVKRKIKKGVVKTPRTSAEVAAKVGQNARFVGKVLAEMARKREIKRAVGKPPRYSQKGS